MRLWLAAGVAAVAAVAAAGAFGVSGTATPEVMRYPTGVDGQGNLYIADTQSPSPATTTIGATLGAFSGAALLTGADTTLAASCTKSWTAAADGLWSDPAKWTPAGVPTSTDDICITVDGNYTVTLEGAGSAASVTLGAAGNLQQPTLVIQDNSVFGAGSLTSAAGFTNDGSVVFETPVGYGATIAVSSGTFTNAAAGSVSVNAGNGSSTINSHVVNEGTFSVASGATLNMSGFAFDQNAGTLTVDGSFSFSGATLTYHGGSIAKPLVLTGATLNLAAPAASPDTFIIQGSNVLAGDVPAGHTVKISGAQVDGNGLLTSAAGFVNHGSLVFDAAYWPASLSISSGAFTNAADGSVSVNAGGNFAYVNGQVVNNGAFGVDSGATLNMSGFAFDQNAGTLTVDGSFSFSGATLTYHGGSIAKPLVLTGATLNLAAPAASPDTFIIQGSNVLAGDVPAGHTVKISGAQVDGNGLLTSAAGFVNHGSLVFDAAYWPASLSISSGAFTNAADGSVSVNAGGNFAYVNGQVVNNGAFGVDSGATLNMSGFAFDQNAGTLTVDGSFSFSGATLTYHGGSIAKPLVLTGATLNLAAPAASPDTFIIQGSNVLAGDVPAGHTVKISGAQVDGNGLLTSAAGFVNHGSLVFDAAYWPASLSISSGAFTNAADGSVSVNAGPNVASVYGHVVNNGAFTVADGATLTGSSTSFDQDGGTLDVSDSFFLGGGSNTLTYNGGDIPKPLVLTGVTLSLAAAAASPDTFVIAGGDTLAGDVPAGHTVKISGAQVYGNGLLTSAAGFVNHGSVVFDPAYWTANLSISSGAFTNAADGSVTVNAGPNTAAVNGQVVNNGAFMIEASGTLNMSGGSAFTQGPAGTFATTIDANANAFGRLTAGGSPMSLDGALKVTTVGSPAVGSTWPIISGANRSGQFATKDFGSTNYDVQYPLDGVTLVAQAPGIHTLHVAKAGAGTVTSSPAGIDCGATCSAEFTDGTVVTLTAVAAAGSTFTGWSGDCSGTGTCTVTMDQSRAVTATFAIHTLTVSKVGSGSGTVTSSPAGIDCGAICSASFAGGTIVTLTATAAPGSAFTGWGGACNGTGSCTVTMDQDRAVSATFDLVGTRTLTVTRTGPGSGTVTSAPAGIDCGSTCSASFPVETMVTLTATAAAGSIFTGWTGDCSGTGTCTVTMDQARAVTATFVPVGTCTKNWDGGAGTTSWDDPANWAPDGVPTATDVACIGSGFTVDHSAGNTDAVSRLQSSGTLILSSGTLSLADATNASSATIFTQSGGTLGGVGALTVSGSFVWTGGEQTDAGTTVLAAGASGTINAPGSAVSLHGGRTLQNSGTLGWSAGTIYAYEGATVENAGTLNASGDDTLLFLGFGAAPLLHNTGTLRKSAGGGTSTIAVAIDNDGSVQANTGTLALGSADAAVAQTGSFGVAAGATLEFAGGSHTLAAGSSVSGAGTVKTSGGLVGFGGSYNVNGTTAVAGGTANVAGAAATTGTLTQSGGTLGGVGALTVSGSFVWTGGEQTDAGTTVLAAGASGTINAPGSAVSLHGGRTLQNSGTLGWSAGTIYAYEGATVENAGTLNASGDDTLLFLGFGAAPLLHNTGTLRKSAGGGTSTIAVAIDNDGSVQANTGTISLSAGDGGASETGSFGGTAAGTLVSFTGGSFSLVTGASLTGRVELAAATVNINGNVPATASSIFNQSGGTLGGVGALTVSGSFVWTGGEQTDAGTTVLAAGASGTINAPGSAVSLHGGRTLQNSGTLGWSAGTIYAYEGATVENAGTLNASGDDTLLFLGFGAAPLLHNTGTLRKSAGGGTSTIAVAIDNDGSVQANTGTISLSAGDGGASETGSFGGTAAGTLVSFTGGSFSLVTGASLTGRVELAAATVNINGNVPATASSIFNQSGGTLGGVGALTVSGSFVWTGGEQTDAGTTVLAAGASGTINAPGSAVSLHGGRTLQNSGTLGWSAGTIYAYEGATVENAGTLNASGDDTLAVPRVRRSAAAAQHRHLQGRGERHAHPGRRSGLHTGAVRHVRHDDRCRHERLRPPDRGRRPREPRRRAQGDHRGLARGRQQLADHLRHQPLGTVRDPRLRQHQLRRPVPGGRRNACAPGGRQPHADGHEGRLRRRHGDELAGRDRLRQHLFRRVHARDYGHADRHSDRRLDLHRLGRRLQRHWHLHGHYGSGQGGERDFRARQPHADRVEGRDGLGDGHQLPGRDRLRQCLLGLVHTRDDSDADGYGGARLDLHRLGRRLQRYRHLRRDDRPATGQ